MRDRLIELIQDSVQGCARHWAEIIADHLLANGVIVPPCKVGDKVYFLHNYDELCEAIIIRIEDNFYTTPQMWITVEFFSKIIGTNTYKSRIDLMLGKVLFFSREEAEQALKEGAEE